MKKHFTGRLHRCCRQIARWISPRHAYQAPVKETVSPAVYLVHHQNMKGPFITLAWLPIPVRPWVLSVFCNQSKCFQHYFSYTFTQRFGMPKALAAIYAFPLSFFISALMKSMRAIPVYRESKAILNTFKESVAALAAGENLLISPDIEYDNTDEVMGEMYHGFLDLEKFYWRQTGKHLAFIPLHLDETQHVIKAGQAIYFASDVNFKQEKSETYQRLKQEFLSLAQFDGTKRRQIELNDQN